MYVSAWHIFQHHNHDLNSKVDGTVTPVGGYTISNENIYRIGNTCFVRFAINGQINITTTNQTLATISDEMRPSKITETTYLPNSAGKSIKARIIQDGSVVFQGIENTSCTWINVVCIYCK